MTFLVQNTTGLPYKSLGEAVKENDLPGLKTMLEKIFGVPEKQLSEHEQTTLNKLVWKCVEEKRDVSLLLLLVEWGAEKDISYPPHAKAAPNEWETLSDHAYDSDHAAALLTLIDIDSTTHLDATGGGNSWLMRALEDRKFEMADALIAHGAPLDHQNLYGNTALHYAVKKQDLQAIAFCLEHNASPLVENSVREVACQQLPESEEPYFEGMTLTPNKLFDLLEDYAAAPDRSQGARSFLENEAFQEAVWHQAQKAAEADKEEPDARWHLTSRFGKPSARTSLSL